MLLTVNRLAIFCFNTEVETLIDGLIIMILTSTGNGHLILTFSRYKCKVTLSHRYRANTDMTLLTGPC